MHSPTLCQNKTNVGIRDSMDTITIAIYEHFCATPIGSQKNCLLVNLLVGITRPSFDSLQKLSKGLHSAIGTRLERLLGTYRVCDTVGEVYELDISLGVFPVWTERQDKPQRGRLRFGVHIG